jgi:hypothetical protein
MATGYSEAYPPCSLHAPCPAAWAATVGCAQNIDFFEGANEPAGAGGNWQAGAIALQHSLYADVAGIAPVLNFSSWQGAGIANGVAQARTVGSQLSAYSNYANLHPYAVGYPEAFGCLTAATCPDYIAGGAYFLQEAAVLNPGQPIAVTETGYMSATNTAGNYGTVGQERYLMRLLFYMWQNNVKRTYIYELADEGGEYFGLMDSGLNPKPAYSAIQNLLATLSDPGYANFSAGKLNYTLGGTLTNVYHLLLEKHTGAFELIMWQGVVSVNASGQALAIAPQTVSLTFPTGPISVKAQTFTNAGSLTAVGITTSNHVVSVPVTDIPTIVTISP